MKRKAFLVFVVLVAILVLAACGGGAATKRLTVQLRSVVFMT
jgi:ABC-type glycerol-3-phosphate transport system substrate-binding protein